MGTHDWEAILRNEAEDLLPPSLMHLLDTSRDQQEIFNRFIQVMTNYHGGVGVGMSEPRREALRNSTRCDLATMNLVATHSETLRQGVSTTLGHFFTHQYEHQDIRRWVLYTLNRALVETSNHSDVKDNVSSFRTLKEYEGRVPMQRRYPLFTDEGFKAQSALVNVISEVYKFNLRTRGRGALIRGVFGYDIPAIGDAFEREVEVVKYILDNPDRYEVIASLITRGITDPATIKQTAEEVAPSLIEGVL